ncbi:hypothetical protein HPB50_013396 [Hyalomma asiaticum]|uniref:Uncharacterized protein n=1 Tax=Hyalomma asiaticum TaxID=266040 RepID=A0ACB7RL09_HYAAI|nr:hypothetical protein HPB50_013396 [Hyalomma asiaticum]
MHLLTSGNVEENPGPNKNDVLATVLATVQRIETGQNEIRGELRDLKHWQASVDVELNQLSARIRSVEVDMTELKRTQPSASDCPKNAYTTLKQLLISRLTPSEPQRLHHSELGDRTPSQLLRHFRQLLHTAGATTTDADSRLLRELFLQRLSVNVRMVLASAADKRLSQLAEIADSVLAIAPPSVAALQPDIAGCAPTTALHDIREQISRLADTVAAMQARSTPEEPQPVLDDAMAMCVCKGAMSDNEFRKMLPVLTVKQQAATYTNGLYVFSSKCSGKDLFAQSASRIESYCWPESRAKKLMCLRKEPLPSA